MLETSSSQTVGVQLPTYADSVALPAFARRCCSNRRTAHSSTAVSSKCEQCYVYNRRRRLNTDWCRSTSARCYGNAEIAGLDIAGLDIEGQDIDGLDNGGPDIDRPDIAGLDNDGRMCGQLTELKLQNFIP